jgi:hypothetical protein
MKPQLASYPALEALLADDAACEQLLQRLQTM